MQKDSGSGESRRRLRSHENGENGCQNRESLKIDIPLDWDEQRRLFGFNNTAAA